MVEDFRVLNNKTISDESAIADLRETIEHLAPSCVFSMIDLLKVYNVILNTMRVRERLVLVTEFGNYQYTVIPFGSKNTPSVFTKAINITFTEVTEFVSNYFDDLTVHSTNPTDHLIHLEKTFQLIHKYNFTLQPEKYHFFQEQIELLSHNVSADGISPSDKLLDKVSVCENPKNKTNVKVFIHLCGFYHSHIQSFVEIASPLTELLKKNVKFEMDERQKHT